MSHDLQKLAEYFSKRLKYLEDLNSYTESHIEDDWKKRRSEIDLQSPSKEDNEAYKYWKYQLPNTFRYTMFVGICTFCEEAVKEIAKCLVCDYEVKLHDKRQTFSRIIGLLTSDGRIKTAEFQGSLKKYNDFIALRSCIVHAWGKVSNVSNPKALKKSIEHFTHRCHNRDFLFKGSG